jgi:hypothetical protein
MGFYSETIGVARLASTERRNIFLFVLTPAVDVNYLGCRRKEEQREFSPAGMALGAAGFSRSHAIYATQCGNVACACRLLRNMQQLGSIQRCLKESG